MANSFKEVAFEILKESGYPLHSREITSRALRKGWLKTAGRTPEATMNAVLIVDINKKQEHSLFVKTGPSTFSLNPGRPDGISWVHEEVLREERQYSISPNISTRQKGDIAEARIAELITMYGDTSLSCYRPISDDEGIDLIVKEKGSLKTVHVQIKSRFGTKTERTYIARVKKRSVTENHHMLFAFCFFDTEAGDLWDYLWLVPAPELVKRAPVITNSRLGPLYSFRSGRVAVPGSGIWDDFLIDKRDIANQIIAHLKRL